MVPGKSKKGTRRKGRKKKGDDRSSTLESFIVNAEKEMKKPKDKQVKDVEASPPAKKKKVSKEPSKEKISKKPVKKKSVQKKKVKSSNIHLMERSDRRRTDVASEKKEPAREIKINIKELSSSDIKGQDINARELKGLIGSMRSKINEKREVGLYFHNDMDGMNGALIIYNMLLDWELEDLLIHASPLEYQEISKLKLDDEMVYIFVDMDISLKGDNIIRIDHHADKRDYKVITDDLLLLTPPEKDYEYPSSATVLCSYLRFISKGGRMSFFNFLRKGPWQKDPYERLLVLLASICDNLWHLNFLIDIPMKRWLQDIEEERYLVLVSISASLLLGDDHRRGELVDRYFRESVSSEEYLNGLLGYITGSRNVLSFAESVSREAETFYNRIFFNITDSIDKTLGELERDMKLFRELENSMPIDMKGNRDKMMELLNTKGDLKDEHWRRIEFYGKEMEKIEGKIKVEERKLLKLRAAKAMFSSEVGPRLCVVIPRQSSKQIKGIIASLLYYKGWKNIVIEERGSEAAWGARGFNKETIDGYFLNLSLGYDELKDYLFMEKVYKDLPSVFKRTVNISGNISFFKTYEGGMGGRGHIFGGSLRGRVPWMFSLLEESGDMEEKVKELMKHKELGNALQGLTEGQSTVSTAQALRAKFKSTGWLVTSLIPGKESADILLGNFKLGILHLVGYNERFQFELVEQEPQIFMDHSRFEIAD